MSLFTIQYVLCDVI